MFAVEPTPQETDDLCDRLFNGPEAEDAANPKITKSVHYGNYIQSGENLSCERAGDERYRFQVREEGRAYEPWIVTPETDLSEVPTDVLEEMDAEMYYCGETDERDAKFSETQSTSRRRSGNGSDGPSPDAPGRQITVRRGIGPPGAIVRQGGAWPLGDRSPVPSLTSGFFVVALGA